MSSPAASWRTFNQRVMIPALRSPLGRFLHSPLLGYTAVLNTTGRRSGKPRAFPVCYALRDGHIYVVSGYGPRSDWYRNLLANPRVVVELPGRTVEGVAEPVTDPRERLTAGTAVLRNTGLALLTQEGLPPVVVTERQVAARDAGAPTVVRVRALEPVEPRLWDPGRWGFLLPHVVAPAAVIGWWLTRRRKRLRRR